ncbi:MAG: metal-dependent hydrolase [Candidatus Aenigmatarchaeota archaeon]
MLLTIVALDLYRDHFTRHKRYFTTNTLLVAGIAGLLPDIYIILSAAVSGLGYSIPLLGHGGVTHTPVFGLIFLLPAAYFWRKEQHKKAVLFAALSFGILFHIFLDFLLVGGSFEGIMLFWPVSVAAFKIHLLSRFGMSAVPAALDAIILLGWLWHEQREHKIRDYI